MKKMIIALAAVATAALAHAASVTWGAAIAGPNYEDMAEGQAAYLLYSASQADLATKITAANPDNWSTWIVDNGSSVVAQYLLTANDVDPNVATFQSSFIRTDANGGVNGYYQIVLFNEDGDAFAVFDAGSVTGISDTTSAGSIVTDWNTTGAAWLGSDGYTGTVAVPEPTSGLLILLGMAGLALKRKRA